MSKQDFESQQQQNRTSFFIEDILYRQKGTDGDGFGVKVEDKEFQQPKLLEKKVEKSVGYSYFQPGVVQNSCVQGFQGPENSGYIQVMGALGAYLGTPYKTITDPYFLTQGKCN